MSNANAPEREPNPVARIIVTRTLQVTAATFPLLLLAQCVVGRERTRWVWPASRLLTAAGLSAYFVATFHPRTPFPGARLLTRLPEEDGESAAYVALTFDDGPFAKTTPRLLDLLAEGGAKGTFFLVGERASAQPELVRRIARGGHAIGIHGLRHRTMALMNARQIKGELDAARRRIEDCLGLPMPTRLLRPPYGFKSQTLMRVAGEDGWTVVAWSRDGRDYDTAMTPALLFRRLRASLKPRDIVLLHERPPGKRHITPEALPEILRECRRRGWECRALSDVFRAR